MPDSVKRIEELKERFEGLPSRLVIISGPSAGAGKGRVITELLGMAQTPIWLSVSITTRQPRSDDKLHHTYTFVSREEFESQESAGELLEANGVTEGNRYGTPLQPILDHLANGQTVLLEIEVNGAQFVRQVLPDALCLFIKPTAGSVEEDLTELRRRLSGRGTNDEASIGRRISQAEHELQLAKELNFYDAWIVNATGQSETAARHILDMIRKRFALE